MDSKTLRKRCEARLRDIPILTPFDIDAFARSVALQRGRPIELFARVLGGGLSGIWVAVPMADLIYYEERTAPPHQTHIILHELGHILCGHRGIPLSALEEVDLPSPERLRGLKREAYSDADEYEAEVFATLIMEHLARTEGNASAVDPGDVVVLRLVESLEGERVG